MANHKYKSPEELGEAVGKKIDELFGGLFDDVSEKKQETAVNTAPLMDANIGSGVEMKSTSMVVPPGQLAQTARQATALNVKQGMPHVAGASTQASDSSRPITAFDQILERIEILILNLEWEISPDLINQISEKFAQLRPLLPEQGPARTIVSMDVRALARFNRPDCVPHKSLIRLLDDSIRALKAICVSQRPLDQALSSSITKNYKEIMAAQPLPIATSSEKPPTEEAPTDYMSLMNKFQTAVHSIEEISQRLGRILGVLRQGGVMSSEEITRRLGTLEHLLSDRVAYLSSVQRDLTSLYPTSSAPSTKAKGFEPTASGEKGLLLITWCGLSLAIPVSNVAAVYTLNKAQAESFMNAPAINMGRQMIVRLPLKKPEGIPTIVPTWLVHITLGSKDYFLLPEKLAGYRRAPKDSDIYTQQE